MSKFQSVEKVRGEYVAQVTVHHNGAFTSGYLAMAGDDKNVLVDRIDYHFNSIMGKNNSHDCLHMVTMPSVVGNEISFGSDTIFPGEYLRNRCHISYRIVRVSDVV